MDLQLSEDQTLLEATLDRVFREHSTGPRIRAAEPVGFDKALWQTLAEQGIPALRVPESNGGGGMSLMHALLASEVAGRHLASAPLVESIVANRVLALSSKSKEAAALLEDCLAGRRIATLALRDAGREPRQMVPAGAIADAVLCLDGDSVTIRSGVSKLPLPKDGEGHSQHGAIAAQVLDLRECAKKTEIPGAAAAFRAGIEEWKVLTAGLLAAIAVKAIENAAAYACEREAFGLKIGEYQGVSHALADAFADADGARMLAWRTVDAIARGEKEAAALVSMLYWWSASTAGNAALKSLRIFGGYGATMEYDAQLYLRRANAHALIGGDPDNELLRAADLLFGPAGGKKAPKVEIPEAGEVAVSFAWDAETEAAREKMRAFVKKHGSPELTRRMRDSLDGWDLDLQKKMAKEGLLYPEMPREYGGLGLSNSAAAATREIAQEAGWHLLVPGVTNILWKMIFHFGTEELKNELLPKVAAGDIYFAMGYTEPSGGSDIFAAKTTATRSGDEWLLNGQKMFTSSGHRSDYNLMVTRTAPDKYKGITLFYAPTRQPGYSATEIKTIGDDRTNVTFYSDVRVPDKYRLGEVNAGVKIMALALAIEQSGGGLYVTGLSHLLHSGLDWARAEKNGSKPIDDVRVRLALAEVATRMNVVDSLARRSVWSFQIDKVLKHQGPMVKLFGSESWMWCSQKLLRLMAPDTLLRGYEGAGVIEWMSRRNIAGTIYAGTSEVQRSLIAEAGLGLPRTRPKK